MSNTCREHNSMQTFYDRETIGIYLKQVVHLNILISWRGIYPHENEFTPARVRDLIPPWLQMDRIRWSCDWSCSQLSICFRRLVFFRLVMICTQNGLSWVFLQETQDVNQISAQNEKSDFSRILRYISTTKIWGVFSTTWFAESI